MFENILTRKSVLFIIITFLIIVTGLSASGKSENLESGELVYPYKIGTTVGMVTDIVQRVAGDKAVVTGIIGEGVDPHLFTATRSDVQVLLQSDIILYVGLLLEGKMSDTLIRVASSGKPVYPVTELLSEEFLLQPEEFEGQYDPHVWMDAEAWGTAVEAVAGILSEFDPPNADMYKANAAEYLKEVVRLDDYAKKVVASIPEKKRVLITAHDAFNYFGKAYGIEVLGIQGISTESEAGLQDINNLVSYIVEKDIEAVFVETSVADKNIRALVEGAAARGHDVKIGGELFSDAMGEPGTYEGTYIGMIDHNATVIANALGGKAPKKGLNGKLTF